MNQLSTYLRYRTFLVIACVLLACVSVSFSAEDEDGDSAAIEQSLQSAREMERHGELLGAQLQYANLIRLLGARAAIGGEDAALHWAYAEAALDHITTMSHTTGETEAVAEIATWLTEQEDAPALLKQRAYWNLAQMRLMQNQVDEAKAAIAPLHLIRHWWLLGPFDNERGRSFDSPLSPETDPITLDVTLPGKGGAISWREIESLDPRAFIDLAAFFDPDTEALAYAVMAVKSPTAREAALRVGSDDAVAGWVNGREVLRDSVEREADLDQRYVGCHLREGWNLILLKIGQAKNQWGFYARLTTPEGETFDDLTYADAPDKITEALVAYEADTDETDQPDVSGGVLTVLADQVKSVANDAEAAYTLGLLLARRNNFGRLSQVDRQLLLRATRGDPENVTYYLGLAEAADESDRLRPDRDENLKRMALEKAAQFGTDEIAARVELARYYIESIENYTLAQQVIDAVLKESPRCPPAQLLRARIARHYEWDAQVRRELDELIKREPAFIPARLEQADFDDRPSGSEVSALAAYKKALQLDALNSDARYRLATMQTKTGEQQAALQTLRDGITLTPYDMSLRRALIKFLLEAGKPEDALVATDEALAIAPRDTALLMRKGEALAKLGKTDAALTLWKEALVIDPNTPGARDYLALHGIEQERPTTRIDDLAAWSKQFADATVAPGEEALNLLYEKVFRVNADGTSAETENRVVRILSREGAEMYSRFPVFYDEAQETVIVHQARVLRPDGSMLEGQVTPIGRPYGRQVKLVTFPQLDKGDILQIEFTRDQFKQGFFGDYFGESFSFQQYTPTLHSRLVLIHPTERTLYFQSSPDVPAAVRTEADGKTTKVWELKNLPAIQTQQYMPPARELSPTLKISTFKDWDAMSKWYWHLIKGQNAATPEIRKKVAELTRGLKTDREKIAAIYAFVTGEVRYVAWEFGVHGYKPYNAGAIFNRRFGDCKDKATLINVMAREAGFEAWPVLIYATDSSDQVGGRGQEEFTLPMLNYFNHCIAMVYIEGEPYYLDGTVSYSTIDTLPRSCAGAEVVVIQPDKGERVRLPAHAPAANFWEEESDITIKGAGRMDMTQRAQSQGQASVYMRAWFRNPKAWDHVIRALGRQHFGEVAAGTVEDFDAEEAGPDRAHLDFRIRIKKYAQRDGQTLRFRVPGLLVQGDIKGGYAMPVKWIDFAPTSTREVDLVLPTLYRLKRDLTIHWPEGFSLQNDLRPVTIDKPFGALSITYDESPGGLTIHYTLELKETRIDPKTYPAFRQFLLAADRLTNTQFILEK